jgi:hypothetical protein
VLAHAGCAAHAPEYQRRGRDPEPNFVDHLEGK